MKIVFDFDGVLTDQTEEAHRVREHLVHEFVRETGLDAGPVEQTLQSGEKALAETPWKYGWEFNERLSAFADEDLFVKCNALTYWVDMTRNPLRDQMNAQGKEARASAVVSERAYQVMLEETRAGILKPLDPASKEVLEGLLTQDHEIVIVSNSGTDRIQHLLSTVGIVPGPKLRIRGGARKFVLGNRSETFPIGHYSVEVDRPDYRKILEEEIPQAVVGDVFSLDLALPAHLAKTDERFRGMRLFLRLRPYTPQWSKDWCAKTGNRQPEVLRMDTISDLFPLLKL